MIGHMHRPDPTDPCPVCGGPVGERYLSTQIYCSPTCRSRATTRRHRGLCISDRLAGAR